MTTVNPPPIKIPDSLARDQETQAFFRTLLESFRLMWIKQGNNPDSGGAMQIVDGGTGSTTASGARENLSLEIGVDVQGWDDDLDDLAALSHALNSFIVSDGTDWTAKTLSETQNILLSNITDLEVDTLTVNGQATLGNTSADDVFVFGTPQFHTYTEYRETTEPSPGTNAARIYAFDQNGETRLRYITPDGLVVDIAQDNNFPVRNNSGANMSKGDVVYVSDQTGNVADVELAQSDSLSTLPAVAVLDEDIDDTDYGIAVKVGIIESIDTSSFNVGDVLYVSASTPGGLTATRPPHPHLNQPVATVLVSGVGNGSIKVDIEYPEGDELGTRQNTYKIGDGTAGTKTLTFDASTDGSIDWDETEFATGGDPFVLEAKSATLTNKTIDSASNTLTLDLSEGTLTGTKSEFDTALSDGTFAFAGGAFHDGFSDFVASEHIDWTADQGATNIDVGNITEAAVTQHESALTIAESQITDGSILARLAANETVSGAWDFTDLVEIIQSGGAAQDFLHLRDSTDGFDLYFHYDGGQHTLRTEANGAGNLLIELGNDGVINIADSTSTINSNRILSTADEGSGNGLDADTLDAQEGSFYRDASNLNAGTLADARVAESNVTQHEAAIDHDALTNFVANEHIDWKNASDNFSTSGTVTVTSGQATIEGGAPRVIFSETDAATTHQETRFRRNNDILTIETRDSGGSIVSNDYLMNIGASGATAHRWQIENSEAARIDSNSDLDLNNNSLINASIAASLIDSGTFTDARVAESNVTQHEDALSIATVASPVDVGAAGGSSVTFSSIPSGVKQITITFANVSGDGSEILRLRLGDSGGIESTSDYYNSASRVSASNTVMEQGSPGSYFPVIISGAAAVEYSGAITLTLADTTNNRWVVAGTLGRTAGTAATLHIGGHKALSAELDRLELSWESADVFDNGIIGITYHK